MRNVGRVAADEVVQLYTHDPVASVTRPVIELQGFCRVTLQPGAVSEVVFLLEVDALGFAGPDLAYCVEPGLIELSVGTSSTDRHSAGTLEVSIDEPVSIDRVFTNRVELRSVDAVPAHQKER